MNYLLDTNVLSEWVQPRPAESVVAWLRAADEESLFMTVVSFGELRRGVELLAPGRRRQQVERWIAHDLAARFRGRVLPFDLPAADWWGRISARSSRAGRAMSAVDAMFAATAKAHGLTLVTRNIRDFESLDVELFNPWDWPGATRG